MIDEIDDIPTFAKRIKAKYPDYNDVDDAELVERVVRKHPVYADKVKLPDGFKLSQSTTGYDNLDSLYEQAGRTHNVPVDLLIEQGRQETINFNPDVMYGRRGSPVGAKGSGQFMPATAARFKVDVNDPKSGIDGQARYMRWLLDRFDGDEDLALAGYNAGEGAVDKFGKKVPPYKETQGYVKNIRDKVNKSRQNFTLRDLYQPVPIDDPPKSTPEAPATIAIQAEAALRDDNDRYGVFTRTPEENAVLGNRPDNALTFYQMKDGGIWLNTKKVIANKKKTKLRSEQDIQQYIDKNPEAAIVLFRGQQATDVGTNTGGNQPAVKTTVIRNGQPIEATSTVVQPGEERKEAEAQQAQFPDGRTELTTTDDVVAGRLMPQIETLGGLEGVAPDTAPPMTEAGGLMYGDPRQVVGQPRGPARVVSKGRVGQSPVTEDVSATDEAEKENARQANLSRQKAALIQKSLKPQAKASVYDFQKKGKIVFPSEMGVSGAKEYTYEKDSELEKGGEYRLKDADGESYLFLPTTGKVVPEGDQTVVQKIELPLPEKGSVTLGTAKQTQTGIVADAVAQKFPNIPKKDIADYFEQYGFTDFETKKELSPERFFRTPFTNPVTGLSETPETDFYNLTQRDLNRIEAFSQERQQKSDKYATALRTNLSEGDDDFTADINAKAQAGMLSVKDADEILSQKREMRKAAIDALKAEAKSYRDTANVPDVEGMTKPYEPTGAEIDAKLKEMTDPENIASANRVQKMAKEISETVKSWGLPGQVTLGAQAVAGNVDALGAAILRPFSGIPGVSNLYKEASEKAQARMLAFENGADDTYTGWAARSVPKVAGDLLILAGLSKVPGFKNRIPLVFATQSAATVAGTGGSIPEIGKAGFEGYLIGHVFAGATKAENVVKNARIGKGFESAFEKRVWNSLSQAEKDEQMALMKGGSSAEKRALLLSNIAGKTVGVATIAGGTGVVAKAGGATDEATADQIATNLFFHFGMPLLHKGAELAEKATGRIARIWSNGKPYDYFLDANGKVQRVVKNVSAELVEMEAVADPKNAVYDKGVAKAEAKISTTPVEKGAEIVGEPKIEVSPDRRYVDRRKQGRAEYEGEARREADRARERESLANIKPVNVENAAKSKDINIQDEWFKVQTEQMTGHRNLDDPEMTKRQLLQVSNAILGGEFVVPEKGFDIVSPEKAYESVEGVPRNLTDVLDPDELEILRDSRNILQADRRANVEKALREGKVVPPEVLADFPELAKKYAKASDKNAELKGVELPVGDDITIFAKNTVVTADRVSEIRKELAKRRNTLNTGIDPTELKLYVELGAAHVEAGARKFAEFAKRMKDEGFDLADKELRNIYARIRGMHGFEGMEDVPTSTKNAVVEAERVERNLSPIEKQAKRDFGTDWEAAAKTIENDPNAANDLVANILTNPRPVSSTENAVLLHGRIKARTEYDNAAKAVNEAYEAQDEGAQLEARTALARASDALYDIDRASRLAGSETGRGLNARRMMANEDFTLAALETRKRAANGGRPLTDVERTNLQKMADAYKAKSEALEVHLGQKESHLAAMRTRAELAEAKNEMAQPFIEKAERFVAALDRRADAARERLKQRGAVFTAGLDPLALKDLAEIGASHIAHVGLDFTKWSREMVKEFGEKIKPHLDTIWAKAQESGANSTLTAYKTRLQNQITDLEKQIQTKQRTVTVRTKTEYDAETQDLIKKRDELKAERDKVIPLARKSLSVKAKQNMYKRSLEQRIEALDKQIKTGEKPTPGKKLPTTPEIDALKAKRDALKAQLPEVDKTISDAQYNKTRETALNKQIKDLETQIASKEQKTAEKKVRALSPENAALIDKRDELKAQYDEIFGKPEMSDEARLKAMKTRTEQRIIDLTKRLEEHNLQPKPKRSPVVMDKEATALKVELEHLKRQFNREIRKDAMRNRSTMEKGFDAFTKWRRFGVLSWPTTLAKLTSAAVQRMAFTPVEELVGAGFSKLPGVRKVAGMAPREGGISVKAEAKAWTSALTSGMKDAWNALKKGSDIDVLFGKDYGDSWMEFPGKVHGALKSPPKRAEYERSLQKRIELAIKNGIDVSDPLIQMEMMTGAYKDANKAIFMNDSRLVRFINNGLRALEQPSKEGKVSLPGKATATGIRTIMPIVKVPINFVGEVMQYAGGMVSGSYKLGKALKSGVDKLSPDEADTIMRHLKKGTIGPALMLLGFFGRASIGGYYQRGEKRDEEDAQAGGIRVFGYNLPRILLHSPPLEMLQIGATIGRVADSKFKKTDEETKGIFQGIIEGATGLTKELPFIEQFSKMEKLLTPGERAEYVGELGKSIAIPGLIQWSANMTDKDNEGNTIKRKPESLMEFIETGVPGLRQNVREKGLAGVRAADNDALRKTTEYKHATTDTIVDAIKVMRAQGRDTADMEENLLQKATNAQKGHTLTEKEVQRIKTVLPDIDLEADEIDAEKMIRPKAPKAPKRPNFTPPPQ